MTPGYQADFTWLMDESSRKKALVKFEIRQLEAKLHRAISLESWSARSSMLTYCTELIVRYTELLKIISPHLTFPQMDEGFGLQTSLSRCYTQLRQYKQQLPALLMRDDELRVMLKLWRHYRKIKSLLAQNALGEQTNTIELNASFNSILQAKTPGLWLHALIDYANQMHENVQALMPQLLQLNHEQLLSLSDQFAQPDLVALINTIFYYKINPNLLYDTMHPEKLISIKSRLTCLHRFIEFFYQNLLHSLWQRNLSSSHDFLFHGDELQEGITVVPDANYQILIREVVKDWRLQELIYPEESGRLQEIFRAYKFWFNPKRLIDAVMSMPYARDVDSFTAQGGNTLFNQQIRLLYQALSTTECLDLYGYFANKDTSYLMRSLKAAFLGNAIEGLPPLEAQQQAAMHHVYMALETVVEVLRTELASRAIVTQPYSRDRKKKNVKPGRRNLQALHHILQLYVDNPTKFNSRLQQIFNQLEE